MKVDLIIDPELEKCLPPLPEIQYQKLKASIGKKYDPAKPIVLWKEYPKTIVDGHHRWRACLELGATPTTVEESFKSRDEAVLYALRRQIEQRNLTADQLVIITEQALSLEEKIEMEMAAKDSKVANLKVGTETPVAVPGTATGRVSEQLAKKAGVSPKTVERLKSVEKKASPEINAKIASGEFSSRMAIDFVRAVPDKVQQSEIVNTGGIEAAKVIASKQRRDDESRVKQQHATDEKERFARFSQKVSEESKKTKDKLRLVLGDSKNSCVLPDQIEMWCNKCCWGFDVFRPLPSEVSCPYCKSGDNLSKRNPDWSPKLEGEYEK